MLKLIRQYSLAILVPLVAFSACGGQRSPFGQYSGPHSLGPYRLNNDVFLTSLLGTLGTKPSGKGTYCFADKEHGLYLYVQPKDNQSGRVANILLSSFPNCRHLPVLATTVDPAVWKTPAGIGIGSTQEAVLRAYGKPVFVGKLDKKSDVGVIAGVHEPGASLASVGDSSYLYSCLINEKEGCPNDLRVTRIGFSKGKVVWIHISNSE